MLDDTLHVRFTESRTAFVRLQPSCFPWQKVSDGLPEDGAWCWVWHTAWAGIDPPLLTQYIAGTGRRYWWTNGAYLSTDQLTHWMLAQVPAPPPGEGA